MQIQTILEMARSRASYEHLAMFLPSFQAMLPTAEHCGDIEQFRVYKKDQSGYTNYIISSDGTTAIAYFQLLGNVLDTAFVAPEERTKGLFAMFLLFLKLNEGISQIILGDQQSSDMIAAVKKIHTRFTTSWVNNAQKIPYDPNTVDRFYTPGLVDNGWQLMLESYGDAKLPSKFFIPENRHTWYHPLLDGRCLD